MKEQNPYLEGIEAARNNKPHQDCPYEAPSKEWQRWNQGWREAGEHLHLLHLENTGQLKNSRNTVPDSGNEFGYIGKN